MTTEQNDDIITWKIERRKDKESKLVFHIVLLLVFTLLLIFSLHQKNILFGIFIIISTGTILFISTGKPEIDLFVIDNNGISINKNMKYNYENLKHFNIYEYSDDYYVLLLEFQAKLKPVLQIRIHNRDKDRIERRLSKKLPKKNIEPTIIDTFQKIIGM